MGKKMSREQEKAMYAKSGGKEYRKDYNEHHMRNPSWMAKHSVKTDIKEMHRLDNIENPSDHTKDKELYKKRLQQTADKEILRQDKKQTRKQEKLLKKQEKETHKLAKQDYQQDQVEESETRADIQKVEGN